MLLILLTIAAVDINAGPALPSCDQSIVTLGATITDPPANWVIQWDDQSEAGEFLTVNPGQTTIYRVTLTNLDTMEVFEDSTRVLVAPLGSDLTGDDFLDILDWFALYNTWGEPAPDPIFDPDDDGMVTILDWFWICNFDDIPPNTPPTLAIEENPLTYQDETVTIQFTIDDAEQNPSLIIGDAANGNTLLLGDELRYIPDEGFFGVDSFTVRVTDGMVTSAPRTITVDVLEPENWGDLFDDIFLPRCFACHIDAVSGGLSLATYNQAQIGGNSGAGFIAGLPEQSPLFLRVADGSMPLGQPVLTSQDIERIRLWIVRGASEF